MVKRYRGERKRQEGGDRYIHLSRSIREKTDILHFGSAPTNATAEKCSKYEHRHRTGKRNTRKNDIGPSANTAIMATSFSSFFVWQEESLPTFAIKKGGGGMWSYSILSKK
jgi:hypothetical protein